MVELNTTKNNVFFLFALEETTAFLSLVFLEQLKKKQTIFQLNAKTNGQPIKHNKKTNVFFLHNAVFRFEPSFF